jgi:hypothetical protein
MPDRSPPESVHNEMVEQTADIDAYLPKLTC